MYNIRFLKTLVIALAVSSVSQAKLAPAVEDTFSVLEAAFSKPSHVLMMEVENFNTPANSSIHKVQVGSMANIQRSILKNQAEALKMRNQMDSNLPAKQRFQIIQTRNAIMHLVENYVPNTCTQHKVDGFTKFEGKLLTEFEPTAIDSRKVESEVIQNIFMMVDRMCTQLRKRIVI
ncbi:MAG: hypothetical protein V4736_16000 [Bdellovibrionota bacterium]